MEKPPLFTDEEIASFRADIASRRVPGAYEPGRWSISPLNRTGTMPASVRLRDSTLRSLETVPGSIPDEAKLHYLRRLVRAGVPEVVGAGAAKRTTAQLRSEVEAVKQENPDCRVICPLVLSPDDIDRAAEAGFDGVQVWVQGFGEAAQIYRRVHDLAWSGEDWRRTMPVQSRAELLGTATRLVGHARDRGLRVATPMLMVGYLTGEHLEETVEALRDATELTLFDGPGALGPEAFALLIEEVRRRTTAEIGLHPHNTFGMAVACAVAAVRAGATVVEVSANGYCGGPGNADLAVTATAFESLYGVSTGIHLGELTGLARAGEELTGLRLARNHPITGEHAFDWGGMDLITQETAVDPLLHNCLAPELVGNRRHRPVTGSSGPYTLTDRLTDLGLDVPHDRVVPLLETLKKQGGTTDADIIRESRRGDHFGGPS
ncbi:hypothetical protein [Actinoplanes sp. NPDC051851]|uniref:hypothetical protein n=1 Tax=Actinoplanes sp. NPDC051851 TaxID=3154753 RepID=UPI003444B4D4